MHKLLTCKPDTCRLEWLRACPDRKIHSAIINLITLYICTHRTQWHTWRPLPAPRSKIWFSSARLWPGLQVSLGPANVDQGLYHKVGKNSTSAFMYLESANVTDRHRNNWHHHDCACTISVSDIHASVHVPLTFENCNDCKNIDAK